MLTGKKKSFVNTLGFHACLVFWSRGRGTNCKKPYPLFNHITSTNTLLEGPKLLNGTHDLALQTNWMNGDDAWVLMYDKVAGTVDFKIDNVNSDKPDADTGEVNKTHR